MTARSTFGQRIRAARPRDKYYDLWDETVSGLGLRIGPSGQRSFFLRRKLPTGKVRSVTLGAADRMSVAEARREARRVLATLLDVPQEEHGPQYPGRPMTEFAEEFLERHARHWKLATLESSTHALRKHILPALGHLAVDEVAVEHVRDWFASMADRPGTANRSMPVLSVMMRMAELWGYRPHNSNPCKNTRRYKTPPKERFLTADEMARLNGVLTRDEYHCPREVAVIRLLLLTGCRYGEVLNLQWDWIRERRILLPDSKSGPRTVWLSSAARAVIDAIPRHGDDCPLLFPSRPPDRPTTMVPHHWARIRREAGLDGLRLHDLRHNWASVAAMNGVDLVTIAKLLGHALVETTERYAHLSDRSVADAADRVSNRIQAALTGRGRKQEGGSRHADG